MKILKWIGIVGAGLLGLAVFVVGGLFIAGSYKFTRTYDVTPAAIAIPTDSAAIENGAYLYAVACSGCHGEDAGGRVVFDDPALGTFYGSNLTAGKGGVGAFYTDIDYVRAIRHGIRSDGKALAIMPSQAYWFYSDDDLGSIIAYLNQVPEVSREWDEGVATPVGKIMIAAGILDIFAAERIDHESTREFAPARGVTVEYGEYLADTGDCVFCHGANLAGGTHPNPDGPAGPNLTPGGPLATWTADDFIQTIRTGVSPDGHELDPIYMPWREMSQMNDDDLKALFLYLKSLEPLMDNEAVASK